MAENDAADDSNERQVTFNIKSSSEQKFVLTIPVSTTVGELKQKLSTTEYADIPAERQRLIYSGRVLKDPDTLESCKVKDGNTIHLVKGADSNSRQNPANTGASTSGGVPNAAANVPSNIASGPGSHNPLAQLTGARYAGFHGLPGMDMFGADGGMGAPPNADQMIRLMEDPNFAQQMNEAMNNPAVIDMLRNNPMIRNNPMAQAAINNPELRRMMMNPQMMRMQLEMQRAMGGGGGSESFPMPGQPDDTATDSTTEARSNTGTTTNDTAHQAGAAAANPFAALFPGAGAGAGTGTTPNSGTNSSAQQAGNPFASMFGDGQGDQQNNPFQQGVAQMMQNPEAMRSLMQMMGGGAGSTDGAANPFGAFGGGFGSPEPPGPPDNRPPEERYAEQLRQLNDMGFFEFERNVQALRRSGGSVQGAIEHLLSGNP